jgi:hypothetical protein
MKNNKQKVKENRKRTKAEKGINKGMSKYAAKQERLRSNR